MTLLGMMNGIGTVNVNVIAETVAETVTRSGNAVAADPGNAGGEHGAERKRSGNAAGNGARIKTVNASVEVVLEIASEIGTGREKRRRKCQKWERFSLMRLFLGIGIGRERGTVGVVIVTKIEIGIGIESVVVIGTEIETVIVSISVRGLSGVERNGRRGDRTMGWEEHWRKPVRICSWTKNPYNQLMATYLLKMDT
uniref:Uncharacterized protein n=1 Tax=Laticauda laticaudata TaxID=8630 RepID=A0A8C5SKC4_LATLA